MANLPPRPPAGSPRRGRRLLDRIEPRDPPRDRDRPFPPPPPRSRDRGWPDRRERSPPPFDRERRPPPPHVDRYRPTPEPRWDDRYVPRRNSRSRSPPRRSRYSPPPPPLRPRSRSPPNSWSARRHRPQRSPSPPRRGRAPPARSPPRRSPPRRSPPRSYLQQEVHNTPEPGLIVEDPPPKLEPPEVKVKEEPKPDIPMPPARDGKPVFSRHVSPPRYPKSEASDVTMRPVSPPRQYKSEIPDEKPAISRPVSPPHIRLQVRDEKPDVSMPLRFDSPPRQPRADVKLDIPTGPRAPASPRDRKPDIRDAPPQPESTAGPPRHPRNRGGSPPMRGAMYQRRGSRSPPRGPRGDRDRTAPPAHAPLHPRGGRGRGGRRGLPSQAATFHAAPSHSASTYPPRPGPSTYPPQTPATPTAPAAALPPQRAAPAAAATPVPEPEPAPAPLPKLPQIPPWDGRDHERLELIERLNASRAHRMSLRTQYVPLEKATRRALAELDIGALELRAVEGRRRVADIHLEKARGGVLGIEYIPPLEDIDVQ